MKFFEASRQRRIPVELAALVDVTFLLIIFLLLTTRFVNESQMRVSLPEAAGHEAQRSAEQFEVIVDLRGRYWVEGHAVRPPTLRNLMRRMRTVSGGDRELSVQIRADERAEHRDVVRVMDAASRLGFSRVSLGVHTPQDESDSALDSAPEAP